MASLLVVQTQAYGGPCTGIELSGEDRWYGLDRELRGLSGVEVRASDAGLDRGIGSVRSEDAEQAFRHNGFGPAVRLSGEILASSRLYPDQDRSPNGDLGAAFRVQVLKLTARAEAAGFEYKLTLQGNTGQPRVTTATVRRAFEKSYLLIGNQKPPLLWSSLTKRNETLFTSRTTLGRNWVLRDVGASWQADWGRWRCYLSNQNGGDGAVEDPLLIGRVEVNLMGQGRWRRERAGSPGERYCQLGFAIADEGSLRDGTILAADLVAVWGRLFLHAEWLDVDSGFTEDAVPVGASQRTSGSADTNPVAVSLAWSPDLNTDWGVRWQRPDQAGIFDLGLVYNRRLESPNLKWQWELNYTEGDDLDRSGTQVVVGLIWRF